MKSFTAGLQNTTTTSYDPTKTTLFGRIFQKTINSQSVLGAPLTQFIDVQTQTGVTPITTYYNPVTGHLFVLNTPAAGTGTVCLYNFSTTTGAYSYVGKITFAVPNTAATTHSVKGFKVYDTGATWQIFVSTTGSVVINGGTYMVYGVTAADFTPGGTAFFSAIADGSRGVYFLQDPAALGSLHVASASGGIAQARTSSDSSINTKLFQQNGSATTLVIYAWDVSVSPVISGKATANANTVAYAGTSPAAYYTTGASNPGWANGDQVVITGTGPANTTTSTNAALQTVYFVRDFQNVSGSYYFNLSTTTGGAAVVPTSSVSGFAMMRAWGIASNMFSFKTGTITPSLTGTILQSNSFDYAVPVSSTVNPALAGADCVTIGTQSTLYLGKLNELSNGVTSWPSLTGCNITGTGVDIVAPQVAFCAYSAVLDKFVFSTNTSTFVVKPHQNNIISQDFGGLSNTYLELQNPVTTSAALAALASLDVKDGWLFLVGSTIGQRGIVVLDMKSETSFGNSYIISSVQSCVAGSILKYIFALEQLFDYTDSLKYEVRSGATSNDSVFSSPSGGWVTVQEAIDNGIGIGPYFQIKLSFYIMTYCANSPAQVYDVAYSLLQPSESSANWVLDNDNTTQGTGSPSYASFYLRSTYTSSVPTLYARVYDNSGNLVFSANSSTNASAFQYSTNGGSTWNNLGTVPNTVGTRVRVLVSPTPSGVALPSLRES